MDKQDYLNRLRQLKHFLKENPEQKRVYSDLHVDQQILKTKHAIMEEENNVENRQLSNDFTETLFNPFL